MSKKYSIVIPTYNHLEDCLKPCLKSIIKYTDLSQVEIIIVANGCTDNTKEYVESLGAPFKLLWIDEPSGYTKSTNEGIKISSGEYVVLLNNDTVLLDQPNNLWLQMMEDPFLIDEKIGLTGPMLSFCHYAQSEFLIFFCTMIKKQVINEIGLLDEIFNPGFGEDTDYCIRAINAGYKIKQIPDNEKQFQDDANKRMIGNFPIYHIGEATIDYLNQESVLQSTFDINGKELVERNRIIMANRYGKGKLKANLGCGDRQIPGFIGIDLYPHDNEIIKMDFKDLSKFEDGIFNEILASHVFEHIIPYEINDVLIEWNRVLSPGGKLTMELPDILEICKHFENSNKDERYRLINCMYGTNYGPGQTHYFGWYDEIVFDHLYGAGFVNFSRQEPQFDSWGYNMRIEAYKG